MPAYRSPEEAARALARVSRYAGWRARPADDPPVLDGVDADAAAAVIAGALVRGPCWLQPDEVVALLGTYGVPRRPDVGSVAAEMVAGVLADPDFGPVVACGLAGRTVELLGDAGGPPRAARPPGGAGAGALAALVPAARRLPRRAEGRRRRRSRTCWCGSPRSPPRTRRSRRWTATRCWSARTGAAVVDARIRVRPPADARPFPALDR